MAGPSKPGSRHPQGLSPSEGTWNTGTERSHRPEHTDTSSAIRSGSLGSAHSSASQDPRPLFSLILALTLVSRICLSFPFCKLGKDASKVSS